jgi:hypothetical protein
MGTFFLKKIKEQDTEFFPDCQALPTRNYLGELEVRMAETK